MKTLIYITVLALTFTSSLHARGGGGGGGHGGGGHGGGGHGGARRPSGGGGHHGGGARGHNGHWSNHSNHHGHGHWGNNNWGGRGYNSWYGPYYYNPYAWGIGGGLFLVGLTFYTSAQFQNTHTWVVSDPDTYNSWASKDDLTIAPLDNDPDGYTALVCSGNSCVKARPANQ